MKTRVHWRVSAWLFAALLWQGIAQAAPDPAALAQARDGLRAAFQVQVEEADRAIASGELEGSGLAHQLRKRGIGHSHLGQYAQAVADFTRAIELDGFNPQFYQDRAIAHVRARDLASANTDLDMVLGLDRENFSGLREKGRVAFYQGEFDQATRYFVRASRAVGRDGQIYAALWANVAALRAGRPAALKLQSSTAAAREAWPMPVADMLIGDLTPERMLELADSAQPKTYLSRQCEAHFYLGQYHLIHGRPEQARASFQAAVDTGKSDYMEYDWALRELETLKN